MGVWRRLTGGMLPEFVSKQKASSQTGFRTIQSLENAPVSSAHRYQDSNKEMWGGKVAMRVKWSEEKKKRGPRSRCVELSGSFVCFLPLHSLNSALNPKVDFPPVSALFLPNYPCIPTFRYLFFAHASSFFPLLKPLHYSCSGCYLISQYNARSAS